MVKYKIAPVSSLSKDLFTIYASSYSQAKPSQLSHLLSKILPVLKFSSYSSEKAEASRLQIDAKQKPNILLSTRMGSHIDQISTISSFGYDPGFRTAPRQEGQDGFEKHACKTNRVTIS